MIFSSDSIGEQAFSKLSIKLFSSNIKKHTKKTFFFAIHSFMKSIFDYINESKNNEKKIKILVIQGSPRNKNSCSGGDSKTEYLMKHAIKKLDKNVDVDILDLTVMDDDAKVQPCKGCVGTSNGYHCHWPCSCYGKNDKIAPDLMYDKDVYKRLENSDGFAVFTPIHWYSVSTQIKAMFDRLVCANLTLTQESAKIITKNDIKNPKKTVALEKSGEFSALRKNHLEGKVAAFFIHGNHGANDYVGRKFPLSMIDEQDYVDPKQAVMPLVLQCRYSGIFVPDNLIKAVTFGYKEPYSAANENIDKYKNVIDDSVNLLQELVQVIRKRKS